MKTNKKNIVIPILTAVIGIVIGFGIFKFSQDDIQSSVAAEETASEEIWTCSMHPQIRKNEPGDCPICGMDLIPLDQSGGSSIVLEMSEDAVKLAQIQTTIVGSSTDDITSLKMSGKIEANETASASLVTHIPGRIEKLYVSFTGEKVRAGQKIATIYSPSLITAQKELIEAEKMKDIQPKLYEAAVNKLKYWKITDDQINDILTSGEVKETFNIYAEYSGVVQKKHVSVGDHLGQGGVLFSVQNLNTLWVVFDVYEKDLPKVSVGDQITFSTPSLPGQKFTANVSFIDPIINPNSRTAKVRVEVFNKGNALKPEMFVSGELVGDFETDMDLTVPKSAVLWTGQRSVVYIKVPDTDLPSYEYREVLLGESLGADYQVIDGLKPGDEVVTNGAFVIDASAQLNNQSSMINGLVGEQKEENLPDYTSSTPDAFKTQLEKLNRTYMVLKDALVSTNSKAAQQSIAELIGSLEEIDMSLVKGDAHKYWMGQMKTIKDNSQMIQATENIKSQREYFVELSKAVVNSNKVFGVKSGTYYEQYCPMANKKEGAYWLSTESGIRNPYFGDKMMTCGEVISKIDNTFKVEKTSNTEPSTSIHNH
ncbi:MAG: efflux RND transporter periplasmic adaptor subunit [Crocinitomicaceae bacterium]